MSVRLEPINKALPQARSGKRADEVRTKITTGMAKLYREAVAEVAMGDIDVDVAMETFAALWNNVSPAVRKKIALEVANLAKVPANQGSAF